MEYFEKLLNLIERWNAKLSGWLVKFFTALWRWQSRRSVPLRFAIGFTGLSLLMTGCAFLAGGYWVSWAGLDEVMTRYLENAGHLAYGTRLAWASAGAAVLCTLATMLAILKKPFVFRLFQVAWAAAFALGFAVFRWTIAAADILNVADHKAFDAVMRDNLWTGSFFFGFFASLWPLFLLVALLSVAARRIYGVSKMPIGGRDVGGELIVSAKTGGKDPRWRSSVYWAISLFLAVLFLPYLMFMWGWEEPYGLPQGSGEMQQQVVVKKMKKQKKQKKLTINPFSPYILERMNIDDVKTLVELENESRDTYQATSTSGLGKGGKGTGGWPSGMEGAAVRFIRLKYRGGDWDQDMGKGADYNLLLKFHELTGFPIARETESKRVAQLARFPKHQAPPFVFLTGSRGLNLSGDEIKALRKYLTDEGGLLFIDNGGGQFGRAVRSLVSRVFPDKPFIDIPNDDPIYQKPFLFPDGAPPFWHHDGTRAKGVRVGDRLAVYYHPGDINDAWKDGHSGASGEVAAQAYRLGINVMYYAFNAYYERHFGGGKDE